MRKPLGLNFDEEELKREKDDILIGAFDEEMIIGCCLLTKIDLQCTRLRQMAVQKSRQGMGIGESMMQFAENIARDRGFRIITMHARETAIGFYERYGYKTKGDEFVEINIPHRIMEKKLM